MEQFKAAFDQIHAESAMKEAAKACLTKNTFHRRAVLRLVPAVLCLLLLLSCTWLYYTPTAQISIEINPLVELTVNRFNRILRARAGNADGEQILEDLQLRHLNCEQAVGQILEDSAVAQLLSSGEVLSVGVIGPQGEQTDTLLSQMEICTNSVEERQCYYATPEHLQQAKQAGLSCGKYRQLLLLQEADPSVTAEQVKGMTMRQIRQQLDALKAAGEDDSECTEATLPEETAPGNGAGKGSCNGEHNGEANGERNGEGNGEGNGNGQGKQYGKGKQGKGK